MGKIFVTGIGVLIGVFAAQLAAATSLSMLYPLYNYPTWWNPDSYIWDDIAAANGTIDITAVINPSDGPGGIGSPNTDYQKGLTDLTAGNVDTLGYVFTEWGNRDIDDVKADIIKYNNDFNPGVDYAVTGIFFDQVSTSTNGDILSYYSELQDFVKNSAEASNLDFVAFNHGTNAPEIYLSLADVNMIFQGTYLDWVSYNTDTYVANYSSSHFGSLVYSTGEVADMQNAIDLALDRNIGFSFVTDDTLSNPWDGFPSYWDDEVNYMATAPVPEPSTWTLFSIGLVGLVAYRWRLRRGQSRFLG